MTGCANRTARARPLVLAACAALGATLLLATPAAAQHDGSTVPTERRGPRSFQDGMPYRGDLQYAGTATLLLDIATQFRSLGDDDSVGAFAPVIAGRWAPSPSYELFVFIPLARTQVSVGDVTAGEAHVGNVSLGLDYTVRPGEATEARVGLRIATPTAQVEDSAPADLVTSQFRYEQVAAASGFRRVWLWGPQQLGLVVPGRLVHRPVEGLRLSVAASGALLLPVGEREGVEATGELFAAVAWETEHVVTGLRGGIVVLPGRTEDVLQSSVEPFVELLLDDFLLGAALTVNLDGPAGFAFDEEGVLGFHLSAGVRVGEGEPSADEPNTAADSDPPSVDGG